MNLPRAAKENHAEQYFAVDGKVFKYLSFPCVRTNNIYVLNFMSILIWRYIYAKTMALQMCFYFVINDVSFVVWKFLRKQSQYAVDTWQHTHTHATGTLFFYNSLKILLFSAAGLTMYANAKYSEQNRMNAFDTV